MGKIPRQRTGSGGWPDRRRTANYRSKHVKGGCALILAIGGAMTTGAGYGAYELARILAT